MIGYDVQDGCRGLFLQESNVKIKNRKCLIFLTFTRKSRRKMDETAFRHEILHSTSVSLFNSLSVASVSTNVFCTHVLPKKIKNYPIS